MPIYIYKAKQGPTEIISGEIEADSQDNAVGKLNEMGFSPISVESKFKISSNDSGRYSHGAESLKAIFVRVKTKDLDAFTWQVASLIKASVPVLQSLSLIAKQTESKALRRVVVDLESQVRAGRSFSEAMVKFPRVFNNLYLNMIKSGERGGVLGDVLNRLARHREKEQDIKRKIQAAMAYPVLMILMGIFTVFAMLTFFLPKVIGLFEKMQQSLPLPTRIVIAASEFMSSYWYWFVVLFSLGLLVIGRVKSGSRKKFIIDTVKLKLPVFGRFIKNSEIARFSRTLALLLKNAIPVYESLELATDTLDNDTLKIKLRRVGREIVNQGSTLSMSLGKIKIFSAFVVNMITVGEEGGRLEESLDEIANVYDREIEQGVKMMTSLLEPLLILLVGSVIGFIIFAMLLPIFNMGIIVG